MLYPNILRYLFDATKQSLLHESISGEVKFSQENVFYVTYRATSNNITKSHRINRICIVDYATTNHCPHRNLQVSNPAEFQVSFNLTQTVDFSLGKTLRPKKPK